MPFTLSHVAAVLPALRRSTSGAVRGRGPLVATALVTGSLAPDVPFFADSLVRGVYGYGAAAHSATGVAVVDPLIAAGLTGCWLFAREPLLDLLPPDARGRVRAVLGADGGRGEWTARTAGWFWVSATAGAATHVVWDAFTHSGRWGVRLLPVLDSELNGTPLSVYAQYGSSAVGLVVLGVWSARALRGTPAPPAAAGDGRPEPPRWARRLALAGIAGTTAAGAGLRCLRWYEEYGADTVAGFVPSALFGGGAGLAAGSMVYAAADRLLARRRRGRAGRSAARQWAADSQSRPTPTETSSGAWRG